MNNDKTIQSLQAEPVHPLHAEAMHCPDACISLYRNVIPGGEDSVILSRLIHNIDWRQESVTLFGKTHLQPRLSAWYGDNDAVYTYSGIRHEPRFWTPLLTTLKTRIETISGHAFNSVLLNYYRDHRDAMGMHSDDEKALGPQPLIASLSLGDTRIFVMKHKQRKDLKPVRIALPSGSLLVMEGDTQQHWKHGIMRTKSPCGARVNLTFRRIFTPACGRQ